ncbi:MAG: hypothetical protein EBX50_18825 [Chitinophagia bacterium]|nr:hypothetical protein [Chitinophagia bacterium]
MTQKEQIALIIKRINILDEQFKYARILLDRIEDRVIALEETINSPYREEREVVFESAWNPDGDDEPDDDED